MEKGKMFNYGVSWNIYLKRAVNNYKRTRRQKKISKPRK